MLLGSHAYQDLNMLGDDEVLMGDIDNYRPSMSSGRVIEVTSESCETESVAEKHDKLGKVEIPTNVN